MLRYLGIRTRFLLFCLIANGAGLLTLLPFVRSDDLERVYVYMAANVVVVGLLGFLVAGSVTGPLLGLREEIEASDRKDAHAGFKAAGGHDEVTSLVAALNDWLAELPESSAAPPAEPAPDDRAPLPEGGQPVAASLSALLELSKVLHSSFDFARAASEILKRANTFLGLEWSSVCLLDTDENALCLVASEGLDAALTERLLVEGKRPVQYEPGRGIAGEVLATGEPLVINRGHRDKRFARFKEFDEHQKRINAIACFPLKVPTQEGEKEGEKEGAYEVVGVLNAFNIKSPPVFRAADAEFLKSVAEILSVLLAKSSRFEHAFIDEVSGLYQYGYWTYHLQEEWERYKRKPFPLGLLRMDVTFSDGLEVGRRNEILARVGELSRQCLRRVDFGCRHAFSFLVALPETDRLGTLFMAGRLKDRVDAAAFDPVTDEEYYTTDVGVATCPEGVADPERLLECVERALDQARRAGDHRLVCFSEGAPPAGAEEERDAEAL